MDNWKTAPRRSARIAERAGQSRNGSGLAATTTNGHANPPPKLKELWALTELNTGEWTRCFIIDLSGHTGLIELLFDYRNVKCLKKDEYYELPLDLRFIPVTSLKKGELVIFRGVIPFQNYLVYNVKTGEVSSFVIGDCYGSSIFERHVNSLVSWKVS